MQGRAAIHPRTVKPSMRLRTFYTIAILLPLAALAAVAALGAGEPTLSAGLPPGATAVWLYPTSAVRGLVAYTIVAAWLLWELRRRTPAGFAPLLWLAPLVSTGVNILVLAPFTLVHGAAREFLADEGLRVVFRLVVRLLIGFAYVGLVVFTRDQLREGGALQADDSA
jgi:hypothetical protein